MNNIQADLAFLTEKIITPPAELGMSPLRSTLELALIKLGHSPASAEAAVNEYCKRTIH